MTIIFNLLQGYSIPNEYIAAQGKINVVVVIVIVVIVVVVVVAASFHLLSGRSRA